LTVREIKKLFPDVEQRKNRKDQCIGRITNSKPLPAAGSWDEPALRQKIAATGVIAFAVINMNFVLRIPRTARTRACRSGQMRSKYLPVRSQKARSGLRQQRLRVNVNDEWRMCNSDRAKIHGTKQITECKCTILCTWRAMRAVTTSSLRIVERA
jgi:hypothetical protein